MVRCVSQAAPVAKAVGIGSKVSFLSFIHLFLQPHMMQPTVHVNLSLTYAISTPLPVTSEKIRKKAWGQHRRARCPWLGRLLIILAPFLLIV
jgi:hypothetical protein